MRPRFQISAAGSIIVILIAALGFAAVGAGGDSDQPAEPQISTLPSSLSGGVAAAGFSAVLNPSIEQFETEEPEAEELVMVEQAPAPRNAPATTTTAPPATTTTAPPATTTTAPPATTTTAPPATTTTAPPATTTTAPPATTTTAPPATTTTTVPPVEGGTRDVEEWRSLVAQYFAADLVDEALVVMRCESLGDPLAYNPRSGASGLFQFIPGTWTWASASAGVGGSSPFEPEANIAAAAWLTQTSVNQGKDAWVHWSCKP